MNGQMTFFDYTREGERKMKGYKAFDKDLKCRGMQYEIGQTYEIEHEPVPCEVGYHFCKSIADCYNYYPMNENTRICEVTALGDVKTDDNIKYCTNKIKIGREVKKPREKSNTSLSSSGYCNSGDCNSGNCNSGDRNSGNSNSGGRNSGNRNSGYWNSGYCNSGYCNSGDCNSGDRNSGYCNSGNWNSGDCNSGDRNSGNWNSGDCNSGDRNSGDRNSGNWNSGNWNSGIFCTAKTPTIRIFDKDSNWTIDDWLYSDAKDVMDQCPYPYSDFIPAEKMSDAEKDNHPEHKTIGGYVKVISVTQEDKQKWWDELTDEERQSVLDLPNFDSNKFYECTGIRIKE